MMSERQPSDDAARARLVQLLKRTGGGDGKAFRTLYLLTAAKLFGICLRICGERRAAEDVLQEVFASVWLRASTYEPSRGSVITWLATITRNRAIDWRRAQHPASPVDEAWDLSDGAIDAEGALLLDERERRLHLCLDQLEDRQRAAIRTAFFSGVTYAELAARADVPLGTMKSWVRRGLLRLRECLDDDA